MPENQTLDVPQPTAGPQTLDVGARVIVPIHYLDTWSSGFAIAGVVDDGSFLGRLSDRSILPDAFAFDDVRLERRRDPFRGIRGSYLDRRPVL